MKNRKLIGVLLIVAPWVILVLTLSIYAVSSFVISQLSVAIEPDLQTMIGIPYAHAAPLNNEPYMSSLGHPNGPVDTFDPSGFAQSTGLGAPQGGESTLPSVVGSILHLGLGLIGIFAVLGILIGTPLGIYFLVTAPPGEVMVARKVKPLKRLSIAFYVVAVITIALALAELVFAVQAYLGVTGGMQSVSPLFSEIFIDLSRTSLFYVSGIIFLFWLGRAAYNLPVENRKKVLPDWLVWGHVVPIYGTFHPLLAYPGFWKETVIVKRVPAAEANRGKYLLIAFLVFHTAMGVIVFATPGMATFASDGDLHRIYLITGIHHLLTVLAGISLIAFVKLATDVSEK